MQQLQDPSVATPLADDIYQRVFSTGWSFLSLPQHFRDAGAKVLGEVATSRPDWRQGHEVFLQQLASVRQSAFMAWRSSPTDETLSALRTARANSRRQVRLLKQQWWQSRLEVMQRASRGKDPSTLYGEARQLGRLLKSQGLTSTPLTTDPHHIGTLAAHFSAVLNVDFSVDPTALDLW